jgi:very-short-patch-repair endonuclease
MPYMIDRELMRLAARQDDVVAVWQLAQMGWTTKAIRHRTAGFRRLHDGVFITAQAPPSERQRWRAASLSTPTTTLSRASAGACWAFRPFGGRIETVTRPGSGGPTRIGTLAVFRSVTLASDVTTRFGMPITTPARTLLDIASDVDDRALRKAFREALRLHLTTASAVADTAARHPNRHGSRRLAALADRYVRLPIDRCRSDAEAMALEILDQARLPIPLVNTFIDGLEADQYHPHLNRVLEIDGPGYHVLRDDDARKTAIWRAAGRGVSRIPSDDIFDHPERFLALVTA